MGRGFVLIKWICADFSLNIKILFLRKRSILFAREKRAIALNKNQKFFRAFSRFSRANFLKKSCQLISINFRAVRFEQFFDFFIVG